MQTPKIKDRIDFLRTAQVEYDSMGQVSNANSLAAKMKDAGLYGSKTSVYTISLVIPKLIKKLKEGNK